MYDSHFLLSWLTYTLFLADINIILLINLGIRDELNTTISCKTDATVLMHKYSYKCTMLTISSAAKRIEYK